MPNNEVNRQRNIAVGQSRASTRAEGRNPSRVLVRSGEERLAHRVLSRPSQSRRRCAVVLLGPPGSGKTTAARCLAARHPVALIEAGTLLETEVRMGTALGQQIRPYKLAGKLVPPDLIKQVIAHGLEAAADAQLVVFDGFPRSAQQIEILSELLDDHHLKLGAVIQLAVDLQTTLDRLSARQVCAQCGAVSNRLAKRPRQEGVCDLCAGKLTQRPDDRPEIIRNRFEVFQAETAPVIEFFQREHPDVFSQEPGSEASDVLADRFWRRIELAMQRDDFCLSATAKALR